MRHFIHKVTQQNLTRLRNISERLLHTKSLSRLYQICTYNTFRTKAYCHLSFQKMLILKTICDRTAKIESKLGGLLRPVRKFTRTHKGSMWEREYALTDPPPWLLNISVWMWGFTITEAFVLETSQSKPHTHLNTQLIDCPTKAQKTDFQSLYGE